MKVRIGYTDYLVPSGDIALIGPLMQLREIEQKGKLWFPKDDKDPQVEVTFLKDEEWSETASEKTVSKTIADLVKEKDSERSAKWKVERERDEFKKKLEAAGLLEKKKDDDSDLPF